MGVQCLSTSVLSTCLFAALNPYLCAVWNALQTSGQPCLPAVNEIRYEKKFEKFAKKEKNMKISHKIQVKKG